MLILANTLILFALPIITIKKKYAISLCGYRGIISCKWKPSLGYLEPFLKRITISRMDKNAL